MTNDDFGNAIVATLLQRVSEQTGLYFSEHRRRAAIRIVEQELEQSPFTELQDFLNHIIVDSNAFEALVAKLTIGETYFFRNPTQFDVIRTAILPAIRNERGSKHRIRIWSAGCSSGEESYSLAMLLHERGIIENSHILATDIAHESLAQARRGRYREWSLRGSGSPLLQNYLRREGSEYLVDERLKSHVVFEYLNLSLDSYPSFSSGTWGLDLIICRNVLIYFDRNTIENVGQRFFNCLSPGGWLVLGASDPLMSSATGFETVTTHAGLAYRRPIARSLTSDPTGSKLQGTDTLCGGENTVVMHSDSPNPPREVPSPETVRQANRQEASLSMADIRMAFDQGFYRSVIRQTRDHGDVVEAASLHVRAIANLDTTEAEHACAVSVKRHPISAELLYLHAVLLLELDRDQEAAEAARGVVFLDRNLAVAHLTLGTALQRLGDVDGARRAFRNAHQICSARPVNEVVPLSNGERAGRLAFSAKQHLALLET